MHPRRVAVGGLLSLVGGLLLGTGLLQGVYGIASWLEQDVFGAGWRPVSAGLVSGLGLALLLMGGTVLRSGLRDEH